MFAEFAVIVLFLAVAFADGVFSGAYFGIENGAVFVESSDCPEQSCVRMGRISKKGQSVACVPAMLYVKITGGDGSGYDAIIG